MHKFCLKNAIDIILEYAKAVRARSRVVIEFDLMNGFLLSLFAIQSR